MGDGERAYKLLEQNIEAAVSKQQAKLEETHRIANTIKALHEVLFYGDVVPEWKSLCGSDQAVKVSAVCEKVLSMLLFKLNET